MRVGINTECPNAPLSLPITSGGAPRTMAMPSYLCHIPSNKPNSRFVLSCSYSDKRAILLLPALLKQSIPKSIDILRLPIHFEADIDIHRIVACDLRRHRIIEVGAHH